MALLLVGLSTGNAVAGDDGPRNASKSRKAEKINAYLEKLGLNNPAIKNFTSSVNERIEGDYLRLAEERYDVGRVVLLFEIDPHISAKQLQLKFQPDNSNMEYTLSTRGAIASYRFEF